MDTSAWVEFFLNSEKSQKVEEIIKQGNVCTSIVTFAEIADWCHKNKVEHRVRECIDGIKKCSEIIDVNESILTNAGRLNYERKKLNKKWGMMDSIILATAQLYNLRIITADNDFRDLENVEII